MSGSSVPGAVADAGRRALASLPLLDGLDPEVRAIVEDAFTTEHYAFGAVIVRQGDDADAMYLLLDGSARVLTVAETGDEVALNVLEAGAVFGDIALLDGGVRTATIRARTPVTAMRLDRGLFGALARRHPELAAEVQRQRKVLMMGDFLALETPLGALAGSVCLAVAQRLREVPITPGDHVVSEGDPPGPIFIVREGRLRVSGAAGREQDARFLRRGDLFGERPLLHAEPWTSTVTAASDGALLELASEAYHELADEHPRLAEILELRASDVSAPGIGSIPLDFAAQTQPPATDGRPATPPTAPATPEPPAPSARGRRDLRGFPVIRQLDETDCGAACLAMVCRHFGRQLSMVRIRSAVATGTDGTSLLGLQRGAEELGLDARPLKASSSRLSALALPAIAHWEGNHWVVLYRVDDDFVRLADPARGLRRIPRGEAEQKLSGFVLTVAPTEAFHVLPDQKTSARWLLAFLRPHRQTLSVALALALLAAGAEMLIPVIGQQVVDHALPQHDRARVNLLALALLGVVVVGAIAMIVQRVALARIAARVDGSLLDFLTGRLLELPMSYFNARRIGDIERRLNSVVLIRKFAVQYGVIAVSAAAQVVVALVLMLVYSPVLTLVFLAVAPLYAALLWASRRRLRPIYDGLEEAFGKYQSRQIDAIKGIESVKALGGERELRALIMRHFTELRGRVYRSDLASLLFEAAVMTLGFLSLALFLWIGSLQVLDKQLTLGGLVAFNSLVLLAGAPLGTLMLLWDQSQYTAVLIGRMNDIIEPEPEQGADRSRLVGVPSLSGAVSLRNVSYAFPGAPATLLRDISLDVPAGTKVAIVGRSGSGKTTLARLLVGLLEPTAGSIHYDTVDLQTLDWRMLRKRVGFVLQDNYLFDDTIARNIAFGEPEPDLARVIAAARIAAAHEFIDRLPFGYESRVGDSGMMLSGGQRQRIAIARAVYHQPPVIILDEATSALDTESELAVKQQLDELLHGRTSFIIAHRLSTVRDADVILVLEDGVIVERGTHAELIARQGLYHYLARRQLEL
jgi:ABC-type bacteriocin/lantibiotic exporter with double-glycine peptidase domain/CRP-like cAMP-binding protein